MLLEFRVKNYKSIRDEMVLSLNATKDNSSLDTHTAVTGIKSIPRVTKGAAIYGANASGKSNLLSALSYMQFVVASSASTSVQQLFCVQPFKLDAKTQQQPSEFEITFLKAGVRYQYGFALNAQRITQEWLLVYKTAKPQHWFSRHYDEQTQADVFEFGSGLTGQKGVWRQSTKPNSLFLSTAVQLNSEQLKDVCAWITNELVFFGTDNLISNDLTVSMIKNDINRHEIRHFLTAADIAINDISVMSRKGFVPTTHFNAATRQVGSGLDEEEILVPQFHHQTDKGQATFELHEESLGTQRLFALAGPVLDILKQGKVLIFDELDSSLHTLLARKLVELFHSLDNNPLGAQLIFSTHDTELLNHDVLRRDQIWFVEKNSQQESCLFPLTEFSPRKSESLEKGYLIGRYGAVPLLEPLLDKQPFGVED